MGCPPPPHWKPATRKQKLCRNRGQSPRLALKVRKLSNSAEPPGPAGPQKKKKIIPPLRNRISLPRSDRAPVAAAQRVGPADPHQRIEVTILLRRRSQPNDYPKISQMGARLPKDRLRLTREQFASTHGADPDAIANIRKFASDFGLQVVSEHPGRRSVVLAGTVEAFSRAFEVELDRKSTRLNSSHLV